MEAPALFTEFLEVCIHTILRLRGVYPDAIFAKHRAFGVAVHMSRHPDLNRYIQETLRAARNLIEARAVGKVVLCLLDGADEVVERYVFDVRDAPATSELDDLGNVAYVEHLMRSILIKLHLVDRQLPPPPKDGGTFTLLLYSRDDAQMRSFVATPDDGWVDVSAEPRLAQPDPSPLIVPVKNVESPLLSFDFNVLVRPDSSRMDET
ncbi:hypothetical protein CTAYLR_008365 [Chrysophaeum taylorii]|uniref:HORMA domain-containing protein n=1 Tax=Chrysophaeum taylorii TaxID=2483200 RepID=A0AAD7XPQ4_9STRA|nr:hypothetical protein CTAYLR_008365 [Chrysophaeum taylorii]